MSLQSFGILDRTLLQRRRHRRAAVLAGVSLAVVVLAMPARGQTITYPTFGERTAPISLTSDTNLEVTSGYSTQSGLISGGFAVTKTGAGSLILTNANTFSGGTVLQQGSLLLQDANALGSGGVSMSNATSLVIAAGVFDNDIAVAGTVTLATEGGGEATGQITGTGGIIAESRLGTLLTMSGLNTYGGGTRLHTMLGVGSDTALGTGAVQMLAGTGLSYRANIALGNRLDAAGNAYLQVDAGQATQNGVFREVGGAANLIKRGAGELVMTKTNLYSGRTVVEAGTLTITAAAGLSDTSDVTIASGAALNLDTGQTVRSLAGAGTLDLTGVVLDVGEDAADTQFSGTMVGGAFSDLRKFGGGKLTLSGNSAGYTGGLTAALGVLEVNGDYSGASVLVAGGTLTGTGNLGDVGMSMGRLAGRAGQTLSMDELRMTAGSAISVALGVPNANAMFNVRGDVRLDGWIDIQDLGGFGPGVYRMLDYGGALTYNGMYFDNLPAGVSDADLELQFLAGQVNIVSSATGPVAFWDGDDSALWNNGAIDGGSGTWSRVNESFTDANGTVNDVMTPAPGFAIFQGPGGTVTVDNSDGQVAVTGMQFASNGYTLTGDSLELDNGDNIFRVGDGSAAGAGYTATVNSELIGVGRLVKSDLGTLVLNNDNNSYSGGTEVRGGTLAVNGRVGDVVVGTDGRLMGIGSVGNITVAGTIAAGNSIGTLHVEGDLIFDPTGIYEVEVDAAGNNDRIEVTGAAYLDGKVVTLASGGNYASATNYTILTADQGVAGTFEDVSSSLAFLDATLVYNANDVQLNLARNGVTFGNVGKTGNQLATGTAVESLGASHTIYDRVLTLSADDARAGFDALSGEVHAALDGVLLTQSQALADTMGDRVAGAFDQGAGTKGLGVWSTGTTSVGRLQGNGNAADTRYSAGNLFVGADALFNQDWMFGVALGYGQTNLSIPDRDSAASSYNYYAGIYGGGEAGNFTFKFGAGYTQHDIDTTRTATMPGFSETLTSERSAGTGQVFGEIGHKFSFDSGLVIEPFANLAHANLYTGAYAEDGGFAALSGAAQNASATNVTLGLRAETRFALGDIEATARGMVGWQHGMGGVLPTATHAFSTGDAFTVAGSAMARDAALVEAGLDLRLTPNANLGMTYNGQFGSGQQHGIKANLSVEF